MSRKDYEALARCFAAMRESAPRTADSEAGELWNLAYNAGREDAARFIADVLEADNPRFDRVVFLEAAQVIA